MEDPEGPVTAVLNLIAGQSVPPDKQQIQLRGNLITFGRAMSNKVVLESLQISRHHASLEFRANTGKWWLKDLSTNGILLNYRKYPKNDWMELQDMDIIQFIPTGALQYRIRYPKPRNLSLPTPASELMLRTVPNIPSQGSSSSQSTTNSQGREREEPIEIDDLDDSDSDSNASISLLSGVNQDEMESMDSPEPVVIQPTGSAKKRLIPPASTSMEGSRKRTCANSPVKKEEAEEEEEEELLELDEEGDSFLRIIKNFRTPPELKRETIIKSPTKTTPVKSKDPLTQLEQIKQDLDYMTAKCRRLEAEKKENKLNYDTIINEIRSEGENYKNEFHKRIVMLLEQDFSCSICSEVFIQATVTDCGHTFCAYCIAEWTKKKTDCPICRKLVTNQAKHIEIENFLSKIHDMMSVEIKMKRTQSIKERDDQQLKTKESEARRRNQTTEYGFAPDRFVDFLAELQHINDMFGGAHRGQAYNNGGVPHPGPGVIPQEIAAVAASTRNAVSAQIRRRSARMRNRGNNDPPQLQRQAPEPQNPGPPAAQPGVIVTETTRRGRGRSRIAHNVNSFPQIQIAPRITISRFANPPAPAPRVITLDDSMDEVAGPAHVVPEPQPGPSRALNC